MSKSAQQQLSMRGALKPASVNSDARTVEVVWTTGAKVKRSSYYDGEYFEELSLNPAHVRMGRLNDGAPLLADHDGGRVADVLGVVESARLEAGQGIATVRFAKDDPEVDKVFRKIQDGIIKNLSVGYRVHKFEKVEGGEGTTPTFRATDWEPFEISVVAMGADAAAHFRGFVESTRGQAPHQEKQAMTEEEIKRAAEIKAAEEKRQLELNTAKEEAVKAEKARAAGIRRAVRTANLGEEVAERLVESNKSLDEVRAEVLEALAKADEEKTVVRAGSTVQITDDSKDKFVRGMSAALFERSGGHIVAEAQRKGISGFEKEKVSLDPGEFRGIKLLELARVCLERAGVSTRGIYNPERIFEMAMTHRTGYAATTDFPVLFENVLNKQLRAAYELASQTWKRWIRPETVTDYRDAHRFLTGSFGTLPVVAEGAEYTNAAIPDGAKVSVNIEKRGRIISITREMLVNDDMSAFAGLAAAFGSGAAESIEEQAYALLAQGSGLGPIFNGQRFFHSSNANVGTGSALTAAGISADKLLLRKQKDISGNRFLNLADHGLILLVPAALEDTAMVLNKDTFDPAQTGQKTNTAKGAFIDVVTSPRLDEVSATRRYIFTAKKEAFVCTFFSGAGEGPQLESQEDFRRDGMSWKAKMEFKVQAFDPKHALTNAGTP